MSLFKLDKDTQKIYDICLNDNIPTDYIKKYKTQIINLVSFIKDLENKEDKITIIRKFSELYNYNLETLVILIYLVFKDEEGIDKLQNTLIKYFNFCNQKKYISIEKYLVNLEDYIDTIKKKIENKINNFKSYISKIKNYYTLFKKIGIHPNNSNLINNITRNEKNYIVKFKNNLIDKNNIKILFNFIKLNDYIKVIFYDDIYKVDKREDYYIPENMYDNESIHFFINYNDVLSYAYITSEGILKINENDVDDVNKIFKDIKFFKIIKRYDNTIEGNIKFYIKNFNELEFYIYILFDKLVNNFIYINEKNFPRSFMKTIYYNFRKSKEEKNIGHFTIKKYFSDYYLIEYKIENKYKTFFENVLSVIFNYINNKEIGEINYNDASITYNQLFEYINEEIKDDFTVNENLLLTTKKIEILKKKNIIFKKNKYVRECDCKHQPVYIDSEDLDDWSDIREKYKNYICPSSYYPSIYLKKGKLPCCSVTRKEKDILAVKEVPPFIKTILGMPSKHFKMYYKGGIENEKTSLSSMIFCLLSIPDIKKKFNLIRIPNKDTFVSKLRKNLNKYCNLEVAYQECFDVKDFKDKIIDHEYLFDSKYFYRILEVIFNLNIFVFNSDKLEKPNCYKFHCREINDKLPCVFLFRENDNYYLIKDEKISTFQLGKRMREYIDYFGYYVIGDDMIKRKNPYSGINWNYIFKDHEILSQRISSSGRAYCFHIKHIYNDMEYDVPIFVPETFPLNVIENTTKIRKNIPDSLVINLLGIPKKRIKDGHFYNMGDLKNAVFVPCNTNSSDKTLFLPFTIQQNDYKNDKIVDLNEIENAARILCKIILYLRYLENITLQDFLKLYVELSDIYIDIRSPEYKNLRYVEIPSQFKNVTKCINYLNNYQPLIFNSGKIHLDLKKYLHISYYLENTKDTPNNTIFKDYTYSFDYDIRGNNKIINGLKSFNSNKNPVPQLLKINIEEELDEYIYKSKNFNKIWWFKRGTQTECIKMCLKWKNITSDTYSKVYYKEYKEDIYQFHSNSEGNVKEYIEIFQNTKLDLFYSMLNIN